MQSVDLLVGKCRPAQLVDLNEYKPAQFIDIAECKSASTQIYGLSDLHLLNLQAVQACAHPSLQPAPPKSTDCQTCTHQIYRPCRPAARLNLSASWRKWVKN